MRAYAFNLQCQFLQQGPVANRRLLMAIACAPWTMEYETTQALVEALGFTLKDGQELLRECDTFFEQYPRWLEGGWGRTVLSEEGLWACLEEMKPEDVTVQKFASAYVKENEECCQEVSEKVTVRAWQELLTAMAADRPLAAEADEWPEALWEAMEERLREYWIWCCERETKSEFLASLPPARVSDVAFYVAWRYVGTSGPIATARAVVERLGRLRLPDDSRRELADWLAFLTFWEKGGLEKQLQAMCSGSQHEHLLRVAQAILAGDPALAMKAARKALKERRYEDVPYFRGPFENFLYGLALYADRQTPSSRKTLEVLLRKCDELTTDEAVLGHFAMAALHSKKKMTDKVTFWQEMDADPISAAVCRATGFALHLDHLYREKACDVDDKAVADVARDYAVFRELWLAAAHPEAKELPALVKKLGMKPLLVAERRAQPWEAALKEMIEEAALARRSRGASQGEASGPAERIYYLLDMKNSEWKVTPRLQKTKNGRTWTAGRDIPLADFASRDVPGMTAQDNEVAGAVHAYANWNGRIAHSLSGARALLALAGCPRVFDAANPEERIEIVKTAEELTVEETKDGYQVKLSTDDAQRVSWGGAVCAVRGPVKGRLEVTEVTPETTKLVAGFKKAGALPREAKDLLTTLLESVSERIPVRSELLQHSEKMAKQKASSNITLRLRPTETGAFDVQAVVRPLPGADVVCEPGKGVEFLAVNVAGRSVQAERSLKKERANFAVLEARLAFLDDCRTDASSWRLDVEGCLGLLNAVRELKDVTLEWPEGEKLKVSRPAIGFSNLNLAVNRMGAWLEVTGDVKVDGRTKLKIAELLEKVRSAKGGFIALGDNDYVALTDALRRELETLERIAGKGKTAKVSVFQSGVLSELEENGAALKADAAFRELRERVAAAERCAPAVPATLKAELRDYQTDGFHWMMRLAAWGAGALLADDMGLGKTVQTIAVLLSRAAEGPQLVVVPASVLFNWREELARFAPSLKQVILNDAEDREKAVKKAGKGVVVLTTYGILTAEVEAVSGKTWTTAVFDEAHNIKNRETKAFKAAAAVPADFRVLLTGTPLQNHLSEIWALFEVAVPGLLGTFSNFADNFVTPVERDHDRAAQRLLKRLVSPFILRRTKTDVLSELPEKTEMTVKVELSKEERALYEEIREEAQGSLESGDVNSMQALAYLTKLRQAACSAELIDPALTIPSSKTRAFLGLTEDLIANNHRALVFSQFTSHLALIRRALDEKGVKYLYLDGATPPAERQKLVEAFEEGTMPLFLISLKAGGTGLNLTAADYVIHMDPWWNPAIEDQASDRAYRIGQERPVTIYRLIAEGTVEEKIIDLHGTKKSLADALLEGTEMSSRLGRDEILELLSLAQ